MPTMPNRLSQATSPYLLQHAQNPVDWWEWGPEALARAQAEDKPIFLSIGYAACHWCHVMAHESFEDPDIARIINQHFIPIKVDREERPDVDAIYMDALTAMTGSGGWPMSMFLTPDGEPFYGGTYFPATERYGLPSFRQVLQSIARSWEQQRPQVQRSAKMMRQRLNASAELTPQPGELSPDILDAAFDSMMRSYDDNEGGFGGRPKFPQAMSLMFLLRQHARTNAPAPLAMVTHTLRKMANGGMYDHLGGGFHRYSTDAAWLVPHFEKMLYDNALLALVYLQAWQITGQPFFRRIVEETLDYVLREMTHPQGGFFSTQDADSEGEEGKFFLWTPAQVAEVLGEAEAAIFNRYYDVTEQGNFEGKNILHVSEDLETLAAHARPDHLHALQDVLTRSRRRLLDARSARVPPARDEKILAAWNGLMMQAFAAAGAALGRQDYVQAAQNNARFIREEMMTGQGRLYRSWKDGRAQLGAYLEDYADVAAGLIALYQTDFNADWLFMAEQMLEVIHRHFWDDAKGGAFQTADDHEQLIVRRKDFYDGAEPSGNSAYAMAALQLARLLDRPEMAERAAGVFRFVRHLLPAQPLGFGHLLCALDFYLRPSREIVLIGQKEKADFRALYDEAARRFLPDAVIAAATPEQAATLARRIPLLADREQIDGRATAYVCRNFICNLPAVTPSALAQQLS